MGVDPRTFGSKVVPGLFFAGELLDVDGAPHGPHCCILFLLALAPTFQLQFAPRSVSCLLL